MIIRDSRRHLQEAGKNYAHHSNFALKAGVLLLWAGIASIIHGVVPAWFPFRARDIVLDLAAKACGERGMASATPHPAQEENAACAVAS